MQPLEAARAGPRNDAAADPQMITKLGGSWRPSTAKPEAAQDDLAWSPADWRLANDGSSECEMALLKSTPVASYLQTHTGTWALGIRETAGLYVEPVVFLPNGCFEFARDVRDASGAVVAVVFLAPDDLGNALDLAAWEPEAGRLALWLGRVSMLGQDNLYGWRFDEPLMAHETPLEWLQAGRQGVFVIDPQRASPLLRMVSRSASSAMSSGGSCKPLLRSARPGSLLPPSGERHESHSASGPGNSARICVAGVGRAMAPRRARC